MSVTLVLDDLWQDVRDYLWAQLETPLSLKCCEQGNYLLLPPGDELDTILPLVALEWTQAPAQALKGFGGMRLTFEVTIHYVRHIPETGILTRLLQQDMLQIANLFSSPPWTSLPGYTTPTKVSIFERSAPSLSVLDTFTELAEPIGHGTVDFTVAVDYYE